LTAANGGPADLEPAPKPLLELRDGLPDVIDDPVGLAAVESNLAAGTGPVAIDAERASGHRYSFRAYLVQLRRTGIGTALVDPIPFGELTTLGAAIGDAEWILHAASQDLPCLNELGMRPRSLFDTELAGRMLNYPRVGLASLVDELLGFAMRKEHSAVDWSRRPLPPSWLLYAALDVEVLIELRERLGAELATAGKLAWAQQEFAWLVRAPATPPRKDPWRRTGGIHRVRTRRGLAIVQALWEMRDQIARAQDSTPSRILRDGAICEAAIAAPTTSQELAALAGFRAPMPRRYLPHWWSAIQATNRQPESQLPEARGRTNGPPPPRAWAEINPAAAVRLRTAREAVALIASENHLPIENLLAPNAIRRLAWDPPEPINAASVRAALETTHARPWQVALTADALADALAEART
jgi:ribonuclease D